MKFVYGFANSNPTLINQSKSKTIKNTIMKKDSFISSITLLRIFSIIFAAAIMSLSLASFTVNKLSTDFLKELGISKTDADKKITESFLGGYLNEYKVKNAKNIAIGNRATVAKDLLSYTKQYVNTSTFQKEYASLRETNKPKEQKVKTPEEMRKEEVDAAKKGVVNAENLLKKADANTKPIFENVLAESKKQLKQAEDPNNKQITAYAKSYPELLKSFQQSNQTELKKWEAQYPAIHLLFVKQRLQQFLNETKDIDFAAELTNKNGKKIFVNPKYEGKSKQWKMAFRAGREVVEPARAFVEQWMGEIK
jgi:hypothetical protein